MSWLVRLTVSVRAGTAMTHIEKMRLQAALQALSGAYATSAPFAQILSRHFARWQRKPQPRARSDDRAKMSVQKRSREVKCSTNEKCASTAATITVRLRAHGRPALRWPRSPAPPPATSSPPTTP